MNPKLLIGISMAALLTISVIALCNKAIENANNIKELEGRHYNDTACLALACNQLDYRINTQENDIENLKYNQVQEGNPGRTIVKGFRG